MSCTVFLSLSDLHIKLLCSNSVHCYSGYITAFSDSARLKPFGMINEYLSLSSLLLCFFDSQC